MAKRTVWLIPVDSFDGSKNIAQAVTEVGSLAEDGISRSGYLASPQFEAAEEIRERVKLRACVIHVPISRLERPHGCRIVM